MKIYILRHGIAEEVHAGQSDSERVLTAEGKKKLRNVLRAAHAADVAPTLILTSPYRRAIQTTEIAVETLNYKGEILRIKALEPGSHPRAVWDEIRAHKDEAEILLSGHEPLLSSLTSYLLGCANLQIDFKKGALACLEIDRFTGDPHGALRWMLTPKLAGG